MKKPALLRAAIGALFPDFARDPDQLAMWIESGSVRATKNGQRGFSWEYQLTVVAEGFTREPEGLFFAVVDWLRRHQPDVTQPNAPGFAFEVDIIDDRTFDVKMILPLREVVTATAITGPAGAGWQIEVQGEPALFTDDEPLGPALTSIWVRGNGGAPVQIAPDPEA